MSQKDAYDQLCQGQRKAVQIRGPSQPPEAVLAGAFNPLHDGHRQMAAVASEILNAPVAFEISIANVDKTPLDWATVERRIGQFATDTAIWLTVAPTFVEKAMLFPNVIFAVGIDTLARIDMSKYYGDGKQGLAEAIEQIATQGCRFLVFGRSDPEQFVTLVDVDLTPELAALCDGVSEAEFREDLSSSEIRIRQRPDRVTD